MYNNAVVKNNSCRQLKRQRLHVTDSTRTCRRCHSNHDVIVSLSSAGRSRDTAITWRLNSITAPNRLHGNTSRVSVLYLYKLAIVDNRYTAVVYTLYT